MTARIVFLDTETTGLNAQQGDRVVELGCVEMMGRAATGRTFHYYLNPQGKSIDAGAQAVHGITAAFLADKPVFKDIAQDFIEFVQGAEIVIHNAPFDVGFLNAELDRIGMKPLKVQAACTITDTLVLAKNQYPGKRNSLDGLCDRFAVNRSNRNLHGALLDARLLAEVYLNLTRSQESLGMALQHASLPKLGRLDPQQLKLFAPTAQDTSAHESYLTAMESGKGGVPTVWRKAL